MKSNGLYVVAPNPQLNELRTFNEEEVKDWKIAKANGELGPFGTIRKRQRFLFS